MNSVSEQKIEMGRRVSAFIALPGGIGTFEEVRANLKFLSLEKIRLRLDLDPRFAHFSPSWLPQQT